MLPVSGKLQLKISGPISERPITSHSGAYSRLDRPGPYSGSLIQRFHSAALARDALELLDHGGDLQPAGPLHERGDLRLGRIHPLVHERDDALAQRPHLLRQLELHRGQSSSRTYSGLAIRSRRRALGRSTASTSPQRSSSSPSRICSASCASSSSSRALASPAAPARSCSSAARSSGPSSSSRSAIASRLAAISASKRVVAVERRAHVHGQMLGGGRDQLVRARAVGGARSGRAARAGRTRSRPPGGRSRQARPSACCPRRARSPRSTQSAPHLRLPSTSQKRTSSGSTGPPPRLFVGAIELLARAEATDLGVIVAKAPRTHAEEAEVLERFAQVRVLPVDDRTQAVARRRSGCRCGSRRAPGAARRARRRSAPPAPAQAELERRARRGPGVEKPAHGRELLLDAAHGQLRKASAPTEWIFASARPVSPASRARTSASSGLRAIARGRLSPSTRSIT